MYQRKTVAIAAIALGTLMVLTGCTGGGEFSLEVKDPALSLVQGEKVTMEVPIARTGGFTGEVTFSTEQIPDGIEVLFDPKQTTTQVSTLTLTALDDASVGSHELTVRGESGRLHDSFTLFLQVEPSPDFGVSLPFAYLTLDQGERTEFEVAVERTGGFADDVRLAVEETPETLTAELLQENDRALLYLDVGRHTPEGTFQLELTASADDRVRTATLEVNVAGVAGFDLRSEPSSLQLTRDDLQEITVHVERWAGFGDPVTLNIDGLPNGVRAEISPDPITGHAGTIVLHADDTARLGTFTFTVTGSADDLEAKTFVDVAIVGR